MALWASRSSSKKKNSYKLFTLVRNSLEWDGGGTRSLDLSPPARIERKSETNINSAFDVVNPARRLMIECSDVATCDEYVDNLRKLMAAM